jgi:4,5-DOPA dioxygenase extradiol
VEPFDWGVRFERRARDLILARDHGPLVAYEGLGADAMLAIPTPEHYLPLLYVLAQQQDGEPTTFPVAGFDGGSISMLSVRVG